MREERGEVRGEEGEDEEGEVRLEEEERLQGGRRGVQRVLLRGREARRGAVAPLVLCERVVRVGFLWLDGAFRERLGEVDAGYFFDGLEDDARYQGAC